MSFKFNVGDQTAGHFAGVMFAVGLESNGSNAYMYVAGVDNDSATKKFRILRLQLSDRTFTELASTPITNQIPNGQEFSIHVEFDPQSGSVTAVLDDGAGNQYQLTATVQNASPLFGIWHNLGLNQTGSICALRYNVSFSGEPNVLGVTAVFGPDYNDNFDWFGVVGHVWWERDDGAFDIVNPQDGCQYVIARDHEEVNPNAEETGVNYHMLRICGDPRDKNNWHHVRRVMSRDQLNAHWMEEFELFVFRDGTWLGVGTIEQHSRVVVSTDQGQTWTALGVLTDENGNQLNKRIHLFPYDPHNTIITVGHVGAPPEYIEVYRGDLYQIRNGNLTVQHVAHIDGVNELAIYPDPNGGYLAYAWARENMPDVIGGYRYRIYRAHLSSDLQNLTLGEQILPDDEYLMAPVWWHGIGHTVFAVVPNQDGTRTLLAGGELVGRDYDPDDDPNDDEETHSGTTWYELGTVQPVQAPARPHFSIVSVQSPDTVRPGETVNVSVTVQNDGDADGTVDVRVRDSGGNVVADRSASIAAGQEATVELSFAAPQQSGDYTYTVEAYNEATGQVDDSREFTLSVRSGPRFEITGVQAPASVEAGSTVAVTVGIRNSGDSAGSATVEIKDGNGNVVASRDVYLNAGQESSVSLSFQAPSSPGTYSYTVDVVNQETMSVDSSSVFSIEVTSPPSGGGVSTSTGGMAVVVLLALLLLVLLLGSRR